MQFDYKPQQLVRFLFTSDDLINIRLTVNKQVRVIQCRTEMMFNAQIDPQVNNTITIENLTKNSVCRINRVNLNYLDITSVAHLFFETYEKETMNKFGEFVSDLYSPDIAIMNFDATQIYKILLPMFKTRQVTWSGVQESNPHS